MYPQVRYFKTLKDPIFSKEIKNEMGKVWVLKWGVIRCCSLQKSNLLYLLRNAARLDYAAFSSWAWPHFAFYHAVIKCIPAWAIISNKWPGTSTEAEHLHHTERVKKRRLWNRDQKQHSLLHTFFLLKTSVSTAECRFSGSIISANPRHVGWMSAIYLKEKKKNLRRKIKSTSHFFPKSKTDVKHLNHLRHQVPVTEQQQKPFESSDVTSGEPN